MKCPPPLQLHHLGVQRTPLLLALHLHRFTLRLSLGFHLLPPRSLYIALALLVLPCGVRVPPRRIGVAARVQHRVGGAADDEDGEPLVMVSLPEVTRAQGWRIVDAVREMRGTHERAGERPAVDVDGSGRRREVVWGRGVLLAALSTAEVEGQNARLGQRWRR
ncbi:hypothetical protein C8J57DRAFT_1624841 [Mycena rebaudengoi]|nr:hypothetical protein C8J57DRAFT_1624841 [Mycena rebaudengoi]